MSHATTVWRKRRRGALLPVLVGAGGLLALGVAQLVPVRHSVEKDLTARSTSALKAAGFDGAQVTFTGRDGVVTLPGTVTAAQVDDALADVRALRGVRVAVVAGGSGTAAGPGGTPTATPTATPTPTTTTPAPTQTATQTDPGTSAAGTGPQVTVARGVSGAVTLSGTVGSAAEHSAVLDAVKAVTTQGTTGDVTVSADAASPAGATGGVDVLDAFLAATGKGGPASTVTLDGQTLVLSGTVADGATKDSLHAAAVAAAGSQEAVRDEIVVDAGAVRSQVRAALAALSPLRFATASPALNHASVAVVAEAARILVANPGVRVRVEGHTDSVGTSAKGMTLSRARAHAVRDLLVAHGVDGDRLEAVGYGETRPKVVEHTAADRAINRRVEFHVL